MKLTAEFFYTALFLPPLTSNIPLTPLLSQTLNLCSFLDVRHQISHPHKMTETMSVLYILVYKSQQDAHVTEFILSDNCSTCFGGHYHPSSGAQNCNYSIW